jgi:hypothetical protein
LPFSRPYVVPDGYTVPLAPGIQAGDLPSGLLIVTLIEAVNVPAEDWFSKSDVFVRHASRSQRP